MNKQEFLNKLGELLGELSVEERREQIDFYSEMISDRMEEGLDESDAVLAVGSVEEVAAQIKQEMARINAIKDISADEGENKKFNSKSKMKPWVIVLIVLGAPIWLSLLVSLLSSVFSLYTVLWSVVIALWSVFGSLAGVGFGGIVSGVFVMFRNPFSGLVLLGAGLASLGLSIFMFLGCLKVNKGMIWLTKLPYVVIKNKLKRRRAENEEIN